MITSAAEFCRLRCSEHHEEYERAASDEAPLAVQLAVIEQRPDMRFWVAHNKTVPAEILERLADDPDWRVRHMVASKNKIAAHLQLRLSADPEVSVRRALVYNKRVTQDTLQRLIDDPDLSIQELAREKIKTRSL